MEGGLQPWQVFSSMFVGFWATSAYFDHFLLTGVFCIAFGVVAEIITKQLYGWQEAGEGGELALKKEELRRLEEQAAREQGELKEQAAREQEEEQAGNQEIWSGAGQEREEEEEEEEEDEDEEDGPPPLPVRDYVPLATLPPPPPVEGAMDRSIYLQEHRMPSIEPEVEVREEVLLFRSMSDEYNQNTSGLDLNMTAEVLATVQDMDQNIVEQTDEGVNGPEKAGELGTQEMLEDEDVGVIEEIHEEDIGVIEDIPEEVMGTADDSFEVEDQILADEGYSTGARGEGIEQRRVAAPFQGGSMLASQTSLLSADVARAVANGVSSSDEEVEEDGGEDGRVFVEDSSDDEELEEEYINREVNFDESESEEEEEVEQEEFDYMRKQEEKLVSLESGPLSSPEEEEGDPGQVLGAVSGDQEVARSQSGDQEATGPELGDWKSTAPESGDQMSTGAESVNQEATLAKSVDCDESGAEPGDVKAAGAESGEQEAASVSSFDCSPVIDIDLTDPEVQAAASKIQSAFKGFKTRKRNQKPD